MQPPKHSSQMFIENYSCYVHLGCSIEERTHKQEVRFSIQVNFKINPGGEFSDQLEETLCYAKVCNLVNELTETKHFQLIESLTFEVLNSLKKLHPEDGFVVTCHKVHPPVSHLLGGVKYVCAT